MKPITASVLIRCGASPVYAARYVEPINGFLDLYQITTFLRLSHFLSQILHESQRLTKTVENLNYSAEALMETWPKRFPTIALANQYARQPQKIANYVYANRLGNGSVESGDGWKYRGRGPMQGTGKGKYITQKKRTGVDYVTYPELMERPADGIRMAFDYWRDNDLNRVADTDNPVAVTKGVNGGLNGYADRLALLRLCKTALAPLFA